METDAQRKDWHREHKAVLLAKGAGVKVDLLESHGSRWGIGHNHLAVKAPHLSFGEFNPACSDHSIHASRTKGTLDQVDCKRCLKSPTLKALLPCK